MKKKNKNKSDNGKRIRGSLKPTKNTNVELMFFEIMASYEVVDINDLESFREYLKDTVAVYFNYAARNINCPVSIDLDCINIITDYLNANYHNEHVSSFAECTLQYYCGYKEHIVDLNTNIPECNSHDKYKAFTQAKRNSVKLIKGYVNKIIEKLSMRFWDNAGNEFINQYKGIEDSIKYICNYITELNIGCMPKKIDCDTFKTAYSCDEHIADLYKISSNKQYYILKKKSYSYTNVKPTCATFILCDICKK